jgi:hypothetical protein
MPRDFNRIVLGLAVFLALVLTPVWTNLFRSVPPLQDPEIATRNIPGKDKCVLPSVEMKVTHMNLLNQWRDSVVRNDQRDYATADGRHFDMSLSRTCMNCHTDKAKFCDRCHNALAVNPYCWDCHVEPLVQPASMGTEVR